MPMETDMLARIHPDAPQGLARGAQNTIGALLHLKGTVAEANNDKERTAVGRATVLKDYAKKQAVPDLFKMKRQHAYAKALVDGQRAQLHKKAAGEAKPATDAEWREIIRKMPDGERPAFVLNHPEVRGPVLREPALAFVTPDIVAHVLRRELEEHHASDLASLDIAERTLEIHSVAVVELEKAVMSLPIVVNGSEVSAFPSKLAFDKWTESELPGQSGKDINAIERAQIAA